MGSDVFIINSLHPLFSIQFFTPGLPLQPRNSITAVGYSEPRMVEYTAVKIPLVEH